MEIYVTTCNYFCLFTYKYYLLFCLKLSMIFYNKVCRKFNRLIFYMNLCNFINADGNHINPILTVVKNFD